ncbi:Inositol-tetrakisphosphate 1-kinase 3 [Turnera subulata]|uniref:Inositol-tetrakisphosphate 1-kinase n=1 Tax=Turnera subulata TaxID=218843 RepID=A0A9Q0F308_9ROSI|nr:Inositol-tetrakisphosphate 1-kinase 3 [Turnera subulata]
MRIKGEIFPQEEEMEEEKEEGKSSPLSLQQPQKVVVVGYALTPKKKKSFLQPKLEVLARSKGILFVAIDLNRPLSDQGPFDIVLHKLSGNDWCKVIEDYRNKHPEVAVLDAPEAIQQLQNRQSMLQDVADLELSDTHGKVCVPRQMVIDDNPSSIPHEVSNAGLRMPLVAKPLIVDGTAKSHELFLAYDQFSLSELEPPLLLQEFVNHGGVLFKIYIVGEAIKVVRRFSLPNVSKRELSKVAGVFRFPRVSSASASADDADLDPLVAELPPRPLLEKLAMELRHRLGLRLFNIDMIRQHGSRDIFYVIDINYFPGNYYFTMIYLLQFCVIQALIASGYGKLPDYEHIFTDFLLSTVQSRCKKRPSI